MKISIIINNYYYGSYLGEAVESALSQTYPNHEVIVVDDGSTDDSGAIIHGFGDRIKAIFKKNGGQASAFNMGFAASSGDVIIFLDSDDLLYNEALSRVVLYWRQGYSRAHWRMPVIDNEGNLTDRCVPDNKDPLAAGDWLPNFLSSGRTASSPTSGNAFAREFLMRLMPMPEAQFRTRADAYLVRASFFAGSILMIDEKLSYYRVHGRNHYAESRWQQNGSLVRLRIDIVFNEIYRELAIMWARENGLELAVSYEPMDFGTIKKRLMSFHLERQKHPVARDTTGKLLRLSLHAAWCDRRRSLASRLRSCMGCILFTVMSPSLRWRSCFGGMDIRNS